VSGERTLVGAARSRYPGEMVRRWLALVPVAAGVLPAQNQVLDVVDGETLYRGGWLVSTSIDIDREESLWAGNRRVDDPDAQHRTRVTTTTGVQYGLRHDLQIGFAVPYVNDDYASNDGDSRTEGLGDVELLAKWRFRGSEAILFVLMFGSFIPIGLFLFPLTVIFDRLGLSSSLAGLIVVYVIYSLPTALFFKNYFVGFPGELIKAARIDGAGLFRIFWSVVLPTARPILMVVVIMSFTNIWNDFLFALVLAPYDSQTVTVGLNNLINVVEERAEYNVHMAAALIAALPTALVYVVAGKYFVRGLTAGAVKG
jgi:ABC-type molybdate transport system permease subunit